MKEPLAGIELPIEALLTEEVVDLIADRVADAMLGREGTPDESPWLYGADAAARYLSWPRERVYKHVVELPHYKHGNALLFRKSELDHFLEALRQPGASSRAR